MPIARAGTLGVRINGANAGQRLNPNYAWYDAANPDLSPTAIAGPPAIGPVGGPGDGPNLREWQESGFPFGSEQSKISYTGTLPPGVKLVQKEVRPESPPGFNPWPVGVLAEWGWAGVPTELGVFNVHVNASSHAGSAGYPGGDFTWTISLAGGCPLIDVTPNELDLFVNVPISLQFAAANGVAPYVWDVADGALPDGLTFSSGGLLEGTPTTEEDYAFTLRATDDNGCPGVIAFSSTVGPEPPPVVVLPLDPTLAGGDREIYYEQQFDAEGGVGAPYVFTLPDSEDEIPPGLTFTPEGLLSGFPTFAGLYVFTVRATDGVGLFGEREYTLVIAGLRILISDGGSGEPMIDITREISQADLELTLNRQAQGHLEIGDAYIPTRGADVVYYARDGVTPLFDGLVLTRRIVGMTESNVANRGTVECVDYSIYFADATVTLDYTGDSEDVALEDVIADIVAQSLAVYGITYTPTATGITLEAFAWTEISVTDAFKRITDATGVVFRERPLKILDVFVPLATPAPVEITDANINAFDLEWSDGPNLPANTVDLLCGPAGEGVATKRWTVDGDTEWEVDIQAVLGNAEPARASHGFLGTTGNFAAGETVTLGSSTYTFRASLVGDVAGEVLIGATEDDSLANLIAAIANAGGAGYAPSTPVNADATAYLRNPSQLAANALTPGAAGNAISVSTTAANALWYGEGAIPISALQLGNDATGVAGWTQGYVLEDPAGAAVARSISNAPDVSGYYVWDVTDGKGTISLGSGDVAPDGTVLELKYLAVFPFHARVPAVAGPPPITFREAHPEIVDYDKGIALATAILERESAGDRELEIFTDVDGFLPGQELTVNTTHRGGIVAMFLVATVRVHLVNAALWEYRITAQQSAEYKGSFVEQWKVLTSGGSSTGTSAPGELTPGGGSTHYPITNTDVAAGAGIEYSKLDLTGSIVNGDIVSLAGSKLTGAYTAAGLTVATARLLGRTSGGAGAVEEISVAGTLSLAGGVLTGAAPAGAALTKADDTNVTLTLTGSPATALLAATTITAGWTGTLAVGRGGTGTATAFTAGSILFAGAAGVYAEDNANLFWDDANNRLGIGTTGPDTKLTVSANVTAPVAGLTGTLAHFLSADGVATRLLFDAFGSSGALDFRRANGTGAAPTAVGSGDGLGVITGQGYYVTGGPAYSGVKARVGLFAAEAWTSTANGTYVSFATTPKLGTALTERVRIDDAGNVGIGVTNPTNRLHVEGIANAYVMYFNNPAAAGTAFGLLIDAGGNASDVAMRVRSTIGAEFLYIRGDGNTGFGVTVPTAVLHLKAGTATASTAPLKFTSGTVLTTAEAGAIEFTTDDYFATITTGAARKAFVLDDGARLTSGKIPVGTTNGRLVDSLLSNATGGIGINGVFNMKNYTVGTLPGGTRGDIAYVTDALAPAFLTAIVGGGGIVTPVFFDGVNWVAM